MPNDLSQDRYAKITMQYVHYLSLHILFALTFTGESLYTASALARAFEYDNGSNHSCIFQIPRLGANLLAQLHIAIYYHIYPSVFNFRKPTGMLQRNRSVQYFDIYRLSSRIFVIH